MGRKKPDAVVEFYEDKRGEWRWRFIAPNGRIMAESGEGYTRKYDCKLAYQRHVENTKKAVAAVVYKDKRGEWRWHVEKRNGRIVSESGEGFTRRNDCKKSFVRHEEYILTERVVVRGL